MTQQVKEGYKVVNGCGSSYYSAVGRLGKVKYSIECWTQPHEGYGPLCVFNTLDAAKEFARIYRLKIIFRCRYVPSEQKKIWNPYDFKSLHHLPPGTVLANEVYLDERVLL
jgi:hypothetical protein